jgi:RHS repeat-associated protein
LPFGETWITEGDKKNAPKYNSQELDRESGYYFYNARHYDPEIGRFVTADTVIDGEYDTQGWNRYSYVKGNPIRYKDPTGHETYLISRDLNGPPAGVHSCNVVLSKNPVKDYGKEYEDKFEKVKLERDAFGYKKGEEIFYRIMGGARGEGDKNPEQHHKLIKSDLSAKDIQAKATYETDKESFMELVTGHPKEYSWTITKGGQ